MNIPLKDLPKQKHTKIPTRNDIDYKPFEEKKYKYIDNLLNELYFSKINIKIPDLKQLKLFFNA